MTDTLTHTEQDVLTEQEAWALTRALAVLRDVERRCSDTALIVNRDDVSSAWYRGRLAEASDGARDAVFTVLNVASNLCGSQHAADAIEADRRR